MKNRNFSQIKITKKDLVRLIPDVKIRKNVVQIIDILEDNKADQICFIDAKENTYFTENLIICQGNSQNHCTSIAEKVGYTLKKKGQVLLGIEGESEGNWVLLDFGEIILHIFHPEIRKYYNLEELHSNHFWLV